MTSSRQEITERVGKVSTPARNDGKWSPRLRKLVSGTSAEVQKWVCSVIDESTSSFQLANLLDDVYDVMSSASGLPPSEMQECVRVWQAADLIASRKVKSVVAQDGLRSSSVDQSTCLILGGEQMSLPMGIVRMPGTTIKKRCIRGIACSMTEQSSATDAKELVKLNKHIALLWGRIWQYVGGL